MIPVAAPRAHRISRGGVQIANRHGEAREFGLLIEGTRGTRALPVRVSRLRDRFEGRPRLRPQAMPVWFPSTPGRRTTMLWRLRQFARDERGEDLIEYGLLAAFVAAVATAVLLSDPLGIK